MPANPVNSRALRRLSAVALLALFPGAVPAAGYYGSGWYGEGGLEQSYDDNISRAGAAADIESDFITRVDAALGHTIMAGSSGRLSIAGRVAYEHFKDFGDLSNVEAGLEGYYVIQPVPGYTSPWYELAARIARIEPDDSGIRRSWAVDAGVSTGRRLTDALIGRLGYEYSQRWAEGRVFDTADHAVTLDLDLSLSARMSAWLAWEFHTGDVTSTATPAPWIHEAAEAWETDEAFGGTAGPLCLPRCAYRLDGTTHIVGAGFGVELTDYVTLDLSGRWFGTEWDGRGSYHGLTLGAGLSFRY